MTTSQNIIYYFEYHIIFLFFKVMNRKFICILQNTRSPHITAHYKNFVFSFDAQSRNRKPAKIQTNFNVFSL